MRKSLLIASLLLLLPSSFVFAKSAHIKGYERNKGTTLAVSDSEGWPVKITSTVHMDASLDSFPSMAVIRLKPYNPWWRVWGGIPDMTTLTVSGLPANTDLHVYTKNYREHEVKKTDTKGTLTFTFPSKPGMQFIIKTKPSTFHIKNNSTGGDCVGQGIGAWNSSTLTCTLTNDVFSTISIDDDTIVLNGNGKTVKNPGGDGISTDANNVVIKNVTIADSFRGAVFLDNSFFFGTVGGTLDGVTLSNNTRQVVISDVSNVSITNANMVGGSTAVMLTNQGGYQLFNSTITSAAVAVAFDNSKGVSIRHLTIQNGSTAIQGSDTVGVTMIQGNFISNAVDVGSFSGTLTLSAGGTDRGNFWDKNTGCIQSTANPSECTNSYSTGGKTDSAPWACKNGWNVTCPVKPPTTTNTPTPTATATPTTSGTIVPTSTPQNGACVPVINNGDSKNKIDVAFIGSGFKNASDFQNIVDEIIDYNGSGYGLMSVEPFKSNRISFNFWRIDSMQTFNKFSPILHFSSSRLINKTCPHNDQQIVLSVTPKFHSHALTNFLSARGGKKAYITVGCEYFGDCDFPLDVDGMMFGNSREDIIRTVVHEFGHSFGGLADEYVYDGFLTLPPVNAPNCDNKKTCDKWSSVTNSCVAGCTTKSWFRPYNNSLMRYQYDLTANFGEVSEIELKKDIKEGISDNFQSTTPSNSLSYMVDLRVSNNLISIASVESIVGNPPNVLNDTSLPYIDIFDADGNSIMRIPIVVPDTTLFTASKDLFESNGTQTKNPSSPILVRAMQFNFSIVIPFFENATRIEIHDPTGKLQSSFDLMRKNISVTICHIPPGNPNNRHALTVGRSALTAHLGHGDYEGSCKDSQDDKDKKEKNDKDDVDKKKEKGNSKKSDHENKK